MKMSAVTDRSAARARLIRASSDSGSASTIASTRSRRHRATRSTMLPSTGISEIGVTVSCPSLYKPTKVDAFSGSAVIAEMNDMLYSLTPTTTTRRANDSAFDSARAARAVNAAALPVSTPAETIHNTGHQRVVCPADGISAKHSSPTAPPTARLPHSTRSRRDALRSRDGAYASARFRIDRVAAVAPIVASTGSPGNTPAPMASHIREASQPLTSNSATSASRVSSTNTCAGRPACRNCLGSARVPAASRPERFNALAAPVRDPSPGSRMVPAESGPVMPTSPGILAADKPRLLIRDTACSPENAALHFNRLLTEGELKSTVSSGSTESQNWYDAATPLSRIPIHGSKPRRTSATKR